MEPIVLLVTVTLVAYGVAILLLAITIRQDRARARAAAAEPLEPVTLPQADGPPLRPEGRVPEFLAKSRYPGL